jgi:nucleolar protein 53
MESLWGGDGLATTPAIEKELDDFVKPAIIKKKAALVRPPSTKYKVKKVEVAMSGQSYHPEFESHQSVLAEAAAKALKKKALRDLEHLPMNKGLAEETMQFITDKESVTFFSCHWITWIKDEEDARVSNDDDDKAISIGKKDKPKVKEKLTRSQRNKKGRHKQFEKDLKARRSEKNFLKQINTYVDDRRIFFKKSHRVSNIAHELKKAEKASKEKRELQKLLLKKKLEEEPEVLISGKRQKLNRDTLVTLSDELSGSLRTLRVCCVSWTSLQNSTFYAYDFV